MGIFRDIGVVDFYFFSGTGNTLSVVRRMAEVFESNGIDVRLHRMEKADPKLIELRHIVGLAFPVAVQGTFPFVWDFFRAMPMADGTPVFMVDTLSEFSGGIVGPLRKLLERKGYRPIGACEIKMPPNIPIVEGDPQKEDEQIQEGLRKAEQYALDLLEERSKWGRIPVLSDALALISQSERSWRLMRKLLTWKVIEEKCVKCRLCVHLCPVSNISWDEYPKYGENCYLCMRCYAFCPTDAITSSSRLFSGRKYKTIRASDILRIKD